MQEIRLTIRKRAFPSQGRVRLNVAHLTSLEIRDGDKVDLVGEATGKSVTAEVIADTMVPEGQIRVSGEDLAVLGLGDGQDVLVTKTPPVEEKVRKMAADATTSISNSAGSLGRAAAKTAGDVRAASKKAGAAVKKGVKNATASKRDL